MPSSAVRRSAPLGLFSAHKLAATGQLILLRLYHLIGLDVCGVDGEDAAQPLHVAAYNGEREVVAWLISSDLTPVTACNASGWQALHCAAAGGYLPTVRYLVEQGGASASARTQPQLHSALHCAAMRGHAACVRYLVEGGGAEVAAASRDGHTALHLAAAMGHSAVVRLLLSSSSDAGPSSPSPAPPLPPIDAADGEGRTALHWAVRHGRADCARLLLRRGADLRRGDAVGLDAPGLAVRWGWADCLRLCDEEAARRGSRLLSDQDWQSNAQRLLAEAIEAEEARSGALQAAGEEEGEEALVLSAFAGDGPEGVGRVAAPDPPPPPSTSLLQRLRELRRLMADWRLQSEGGGAGEDCGAAEPLVDDGH